MRRWLVAALATDCVDDQSSSSSRSGSSSGSYLRYETEVPSEVLELTVSTGSGTASSSGQAGEDKSLELWLSISIPLVLFLAFAVVMFFCCRKEKHMETEADLEVGGHNSFVFHTHRRNKGATAAVATLTEEDEEALASWRIDAESIEPIRPLGAGAYGTVWLASFLGETVVVKKLSPPLPPSIPRTKSWRKNQRQSATGGATASNSRTRSKSKSRGPPGQSSLQRFVSEIRFLATLSHPKIVAFYGVAWTTPSRLDTSHGPASGNAANLQMVLEFMSGGDLRQYLARTRSDIRARSWGPRKMTMALDIAEALAYLHSRHPEPILHRDLKSRNILLDSTYTAKVADFGVSRYGIPHSMEGEDVDDDEVGQFAMTRSIGTSRWIAPEVLAGEARYSAAVDVYSFGIILSELDSHELPFADLSLSNGEPLSENRIIELLRSGALHPSLSDRCPRGVAMLMTECLTLEPTLRPTSAQVADRLRNLLDRERRVSEIGDDVSFSSMSGPNSFLGVREDTSSAYSGSITSSNLSIERAFHYAVLEEQ